MTILYTVNKSPFEHAALDSCLRLAEPGSAILLLENGVNAAIANTSYADKLTAALYNHPLYILQPDSDARGITSRLIKGVHLINYAGFVDLVSAHTKVQAWF